MANTAFSDYTEANIVKHLFRTGTWSKTATLYFALMTATPSDSGGGTEVTGGNYARVAVTPSDANFTVTGNTVTNINAITFPTPSADWGTVTQMAIYDASTSGNLLLWSDLSAPKSILSTDPAPSYVSGAFSCTYTSTSTELATQVLSYIFKTMAVWTKPSTLYFDLYTVAPTIAGGGTKVTGGSYAAYSITPLDANFTQTVNGSNGTTSVTNAANITYPSPTADWGVVVAQGCSTNTGFFVGFGAVSPRTVNSGDSAPLVAAGGFVFAVN